MKNDLPTGKYENTTTNNIPTMKPMGMKKPYIIVIEGLDGSGKETTTKALNQFLSKRGYKVKMVSFPMYDKWHSILVRYFLKGKFGKSPYSVSPKIASIFYAIDRFFGYNFDIKKQLKNEITESGEPYDFIIFDRYTTSNMLYQAVKAEDTLSRNKILKFIETVEYRVFRLPRPDKVFVLTTDMNQAKIAMKNREFLDIHEKDSGYQEKIHGMIDKLAKKYNWIKMDTRKSVEPYEWIPVEDTVEIMYGYIDYWALDVFDPFDAHSN